MSSVYFGGRREVKWMICVNCNSEIHEDDIFCDQCGKQIADMVCSDCDTINRPISKYCSNCGSKNLLRNLRKISDQQPWTEEDIQNLL